MNIDSRLVWTIDIFWYSRRNSFNSERKLNHTEMGTMTSIHTQMIQTKPMKKNSNPKFESNALLTRYNSKILFWFLFAVVLGWLITSSTEYECDSESKYECYLYEVRTAFLWLSSLCEEFLWLLSLLLLLLFLPFLCLQHSSERSSNYIYNVKDIFIFMISAKKAKMQYASNRGDSQVKNMSLLSSKQFTWQIYSYLYEISLLFWT